VLGTEKKVSVLMTSFNSLPYIEEAIDCILCQTYSNFEIIVVDDHSTDGTFDFLKGKEKKLNGKLKVFLNSTKGRGKALNLGLSKCEGEYVAINDADDFSLPLRLQKQVKFLNENKEYGLVGSMSVLRLLESGVIVEHSQERPINDNDIRLFFLKGQPIQHVTVMFRTDLAKKVNGYNEEIKFLFDRDLFLKIGKISKLHNLEDVLVQVGEHNKRYFKLKHVGLERAKLSTKYQLKAVDDFNFSPLYKIPILAKYFWSVFLEIKNKLTFKKA
jgi:glycosyltransferase involved in cell wall biosynthesis